MIALTQNELKIVKHVLKEILPDREVALFGSRATQHYKPHSDLDLCVMGKSALSLQTLSNLKEAFSESDLPMRVDIIDWASTSPEFREIIKKTYTPLTEKK